MIYHFWGDTFKKLTDTREPSFVRVIALFSYRHFSQICLLLFLQIFLFHPILSIVQIPNCTDGTPAVLPCDQTTKLCPGNPELGCELHFPVYFCCGILNPGTDKTTKQPTTTTTFPPSDDNCLDKFIQCWHWAKRGFCFLLMYTDRTKAKLCPRTCRLCHLAPQ